MRLYSYIVARDYGFAPNPFHGYCTLATCKPNIRKRAEVDDWIVGTGSKKLGYEEKIIFLMKVTEKIDYHQYWAEERFQCKKPHFNKSLKYAYGDNIYHTDYNSDTWIQEDSHHSNSDGSVNIKNLKRDINGEFVLISDQFYFFGRNAIKIPKRFLKDKSSICHKTQGYKSNFTEKEINSFIGWFMKRIKEPGYFGDPIQFNKFVRYRGPNK